MFNKINGDKLFKNSKILKLFFEHASREFNVREVARILKITPATASKRLTELTREGVLKGRKERVLKLYRADLESDLYRDMKTLYNIRKLKDSGLVDQLNEYYLKPTIVLFGSASFGMDDDTSDIDLLVVSEKTTRFAGLDIFEKKLKREIQIFAVRKIKDLRNKHLINNVLNGITIQGEVKWT